MAETTTAKPATTNPRSRSRAAAKPATTAKAAAAKPSTAKAEAPATVEETSTPGRLKIELESTDSTKTYDKFEVPEEFKGTAAGTIYAPHGALRVIVLIVLDDEGND